jgi:SAM-dependent methyltransferase
MEQPDWPAYYAVTAERPAWTTATLAAEAFGELPPGSRPRRAVDLGCGAGRDARELLRRGWHVLAVDLEAAAIETLRSLTPPGDLDRLETRVADLASFRVPSCDLVNASLSLPFLAPDGYAAAWRSIREALVSGGRFAGMLFGDRDGAAGEPDMTCPSPDVIRGWLEGFEVEHWSEKEEDGHTALGEPHHFHLVEVVAVRRADGRSGHGQRSRTTRGSRRADPSQPVARTTPGVG